MTKINIRSQVEQEQWKHLEALARETHKSISDLLTEAIGDYVRKHRKRPAVSSHLEQSIKDNEELGDRLAE